MNQSAPNYLTESNNVKFTTICELIQEKENKVLITFTRVVHSMLCFLWSVFFSQNPIPLCSIFLCLGDKLLHSATRLLRTTKRDVSVQLSECPSFILSGNKRRKTGNAFYKLTSVVFLGQKFLILKKKPLKTRRHLLCLFHSANNVLLCLICNPAQLNITLLTQTYSNYRSYCKAVLN